MHLWEQREEANFRFSIGFVDDTYILRDNDDDVLYIYVVP